MLRRRLLAAAAKLAHEGHSASLSPLVNQLGYDCWQALPGGPAAACAHASRSAAGSCRWHSELVQRSSQDNQEVVYEAPFGKLVGRVKKLSLFSCVCALGAGPVILGLDASTALTAKLSVAATLASFGVFTTGLLTWFTQPYITRLRYDPPTQTVEVTTLSLLGLPRNHRFHLGEVGEADTMHPLTSFQARGNLFYIDTDNFRDKALLARLVPQAAAAQAMHDGTLLYMLHSLSIPGHMPLSSNSSSSLAPA